MKTLFWPYILFGKTFHKAYLFSYCSYNYDTSVYGDNSSTDELKPYKTMKCEEWKQTNLRKTDQEKGSRNENW